MALAQHPDVALQVAFARHLRDPDRHPAPPGLDPARVATYRRLFFNNVLSLLSANFPVISRLLGEQWPALVRRFYAGFPSHVPLFTELAREFVRFVEALPAADLAERPFLPELAHYEWAELALMLDPAELDQIAVDADADLLEHQVVVSPCAWLLVYDFPVHAIRPDFQPTVAPAERSCLVVCRDRADQIHFVSLNLVSARLLELLREPGCARGLDAVAQVASELGMATDALVPAARQLLEQWLARDIVLGARHPAG